MAGRSRAIKNVQSHVNWLDNHCGIGPLKQGTPPKTGVTHYYWFNLQSQANPSTHFNPDVLTGRGKFVGFGNLIWIGHKPPPYKVSPKNHYANIFQPVY